MKDDALEAFEILLEAMKNEKNQLANEVKEATLNSQFDRAQRLLTKAEQIERLMEQARQLKEAWKRLSEEKFNEKFDATQQTAKGQLEVSDQNDKAPEIEIIRQLFGERGKRRRKKREPVNKTPQHAYRVPILEALEQLGGRGSAQEVLKIVYDKMKERLTEDDLKLLPSGKDARWSNTARWERSKMVKEGLLRNDLPVGVWEIAEKGREYLEQVRRKGENEQDWDKLMEIEEGGKP